MSALFTVLMVALFVRVIASWFGISPYRPWMRPVMALTDWLIDPIRRILPPVGMIDFSPMVAWLVLSLVRGFVLSLMSSDVRLIGQPSSRTDLAHGDVRWYRSSGGRAANEPWSAPGRRSGLRQRCGDRSDRPRWLDGIVEAARRLWPDRQARRLA